MKNDILSLKPTLKPLLSSAPCWLVGGLLRDALLGRPLRDVDLAVQGDPAKAARLLAAALKSKVFPLDKKRGTYRVVQTQKGLSRVFDFSKLQGKSIEQDLQRRDFTVNALALPLERLFKPGDWRRDLLDLAEGQKDLKARRIRLTNPSVLKDDPLRLLRAFRFSAELGFSITPETLSAVEKSRALIRKSAAERVREELFKTLSTPRAGETFRAMDRAKLLTVLFPEGESMRKTAHVYYGKDGVWGHSLDALASFDRLMNELPVLFPEFHQPLVDHLRETVAGFPRYALLKLVELLHDVGKPATAKVEGGKLHFHGHDHVGRDLAAKIGERLRLSNEENRSLAAMVGAHMRPGNLGHQPVLTDRAVYRFYRDLQGDAVGMLVVALADHFTYLNDKQRKSRKDPVYLAIHKLLSSHFLTPEAVHPPKLVDGHVLMEKLGLEEGPVLGRLLNAIREAQATKKVKTPEQAVRWAEKILKSGKANVPEKPRPEDKAFEDAKGLRF